MNTEIKPGTLVRRKFHSDEVMKVVDVAGNLVIRNEYDFFHTVSWSTFDTVYEVVQL